MNKANDALERLVQHSGLPVAGKEPPRDTLAEFVFRTTRGGSCPDLQATMADIIRCLDRMNRNVNRAGADGSTQMLPPELVYAVSGMIGMCLDKALELQSQDPISKMAHDLLVAAWRIQCAWDALLAGDIENLHQHVAQEAQARGFVAYSDSQK